MDIVEALTLTTHLNISLSICLNGRPVITCVRPCDIRTHSSFRLQPDNMARIAPRPRPQVTYKPIEQMIFINSYHATPLRSHPMICFRNKKVIAQLFCLSVARQCRGLPLPSIPTEVETISKVTLTTSHSHLNTHLRSTILDLLLH